MIKILYFIFYEEKESFCDPGPHIERNINADAVETEELRHRCPITELKFFEQRKRCGWS